MRVWGDLIDARRYIGTCTTPYPLPATTTMPGVRSWVHSVKPLGDFKQVASGYSDPTTLPHLLEATSDTSGKPDGALARALALLFEPSPVLYNTLVPGVAAHIQQARAPVLSYFQLIDTALAVLASWADDLKAQFVAGHPRIGEVNGLSRLSAQEQAAKATPSDVLARLAHLNACYEHRYPGLIYITFVNGRSRAEIKDEMEDALGLEHSFNPDQPPVENVGSVEVGSEEWKKELERAVADVGKIAKSRVGTLAIDAGESWMPLACVAATYKTTPTSQLDPHRPRAGRRLGKGYTMYAAEQYMTLLGLTVRRPAYNQ
ncbi:OHCU decarboxylase-domain-containing protein [Trametes elegans]|nr:OHCU decarboxylase-domain-containing protein [Trametes elegans]